MKNNEKKDVLIIGGGLAGLAAALSLKDQGLDVLLLEADTRLGGRVKTVEFESLKIEMGGEWIGAKHNLIQSLCQRFNLRLIPHELKPCIKIDNHQIDEDFAISLNRRVEMVTLYERWLKQRGEYSATASYKEFLEACCLGQEEIAREKLLIKYIYGEDISRLSAADVCSDLRDGVVDKEDSYWIEGGNNRLVNCLANNLGDDNIILGVKIKSIKQGQLIAAFSDDLTVKTETAILAIPPFAALEINWVPSLPTRVIKALREINYVHVAKVASIFPDRFWGKEEFGMFQPQLGTPEFIYHSTLGQPEKKGVLTAFAIGKNAAEICRLDEERRRKFILSQLSKKFENMPHILHSEVADWEKAYSVYTKEHFNQTVAILNNPWLNVYFAGEHMPKDFNKQGYMEGAVSSGLEAASQIINRASFK